MKELWMSGSGVLARTLQNQVKKALEATDGNRAAAARLLGIGERTMYRAVKALGVKAVELEECPKCKGRGRVPVAHKR